MHLPARMELPYPRLKRLVSTGLATSLLQAVVHPETGAGAALCMNLTMAVEGRGGDVDSLLEVALWG
ncbi:MAG: hypothetical protein WCL32_09890, partial [Planctomycetota bacterium]